MSLRYLIVPWAAPASAAFLMGVTFFFDQETEWGWALAVIGGVLVGLTIELTGQYIARSLATFFEDQRWILFGVCVVALGTYAITGVVRYWGTWLLMIFVLISVLYVVIGFTDTRKEFRSEGQENAAVDLARAEIEVKRINAEKNKLNAQSRQMERGLNFEPIGGVNSSGTAGTYQRESVVNKIEPPVGTKAEVIWPWLDANYHQKLHIRDIVAGTGVNSTNTCSRWFKEWLKEKGKKHRGIKKL